MAGYRQRLRIASGRLTPTVQAVNCQLSTLLPSSLIVKFGIIVFPGSNCDRDVVYVTRDLLGQPTRTIWHEETDLHDVDVVVIPGGLVMVTICAVVRLPDFHQL